MRERNPSRAACGHALPGIQSAMSTGAIPARWCHAGQLPPTAAGMHAAHEPTSSSASSSSSCNTTRSRVEAGVSLPAAAGSGRAAA